MNATALLKHYAQVADAPDAVARLKQLVLDLSVRGKLTDYSVNQRDVYQLGDVSEFVMGQAPPGSACNTVGDGTIFVKVGEFGDRFPRTEVWTSEPLKRARVGDVLICVVGATIGKLNLGIDCAIGRSVAAIRPQPTIDQVFLYYSLTPVMAKLREGARGSAQGVISRPDLAAIEIWAPPLAEQHRIVAKVDELMALCDRLEAARAKREVTRDRLAAASLARLKSPDPDPETFKAHARFAISTALPALTTRPDQIKQLRQTILNLAVHGRLVSQNASDEHASEILKKLSADRERYWERTRKAKSGGYVAPDHEEGLFALPPSWTWASALEICESVESGSTPPATEMYDGAGEIPFIKVYNLTKSGSLDFSVRPTFISRSTHEGRLSRSRIRPDDVLMNIVGPPLGKVSLVPHTYPEWNTNQAVVAFRPCEVLLPEYLSVCLLSESVLSWIIDLAQQTVGQVNISVTKSRRLPIPLPPLAEQHRIVTKVNELMQLCDQLEASLESGSAARRRLLDALLHEALAPAKEFEEAA